MEYKSIQKHLANLNITSLEEGTVIGEKIINEKTFIDSFSPVDGKKIASISLTSNDGYEKTIFEAQKAFLEWRKVCLLYTSPSPRDKRQSRMPSSA